MLFTPSEIDVFVESGYLVLRGAFDRAIAKAARAAIWNRIGDSWDKCESSGQPMIHLRENLSGPPFNRIMNARIRAAFDDLLGDGRWAFDEHYGWWPILLPGFPGPSGWHIDGVTRHRFGRPAKGLTTLFLFSDVAAGDGGTPLVPGSHREIARLLAAAEPGGLSGQELMHRFGAVDLDRVAAVTGQAGDIALMHPYLVHGFGPNAGMRIRFACNPFVELRAPLQLAPEAVHRSPVEQAISAAVR